MRSMTLATALLVSVAALHCDKPSSSEAPATPASPAAVSTTPPTHAATHPPPPATTTAAPVGSAAKIPSDKIDPAGKSAADRVAKAYAGALKTGSFADTADLSDELKKMTPAQWKQVLDMTKNKYGDNKSIDFVDAWDDEKGGKMYRYKAAFTKAEKLEFRVDLNDKNIATKFGTYDWIENTP